MRRSRTAALALVACIACGFPQHGLGSAGDAGVACGPGKAMCADGCVDLSQQTTDCGACGVACTVEHGTAWCAQGACMHQCDPGWDHCGAAAATGCDTNTASDPANCGRCNHPCGGGACAGGVCQPQVVAQGEAAPVGVAVDADHVFWVDDGLANGRGSVVQATHDGMQRTTIATGRNHPWGIALDPYDVYFTELGSANYDLDGVVSRVAKGGGALTTLALTQPQPMGIAVADPFVYFARARDGTVFRIGTDASSPVPLAVAQPAPVYLTLAGTDVYWTNAGSGGPDGSVQRAPAATGGPVAVAGAQQDPLGLAADTKNVYWVDLLGGTVSSAPLGGGPATVLLANLSHPEVIATDGAELFVGLEGPPMAKAGASVVALGTDGKCGPSACPRVLAAGLQSVGGIAVDPEAVYWTDTTAGQVLRLAK